jgi:tetratricopeptide (TPR) repeat protein/CHAT domain-containing protein
MVKKTVLALIACAILVLPLTSSSVLSESWKELLDEADSLSNAANYDSAIVLGSLALKQAEEELGEDDTLVALVLDEVGAYHYFKADYDQAESVWKRALETREQALDPEHVDLAKALHNLATLYDDQGRYDESEPLHERALSIREKVLGAHHPDVAVSLINIGNLYYDKGKYRKAIRLHKRALAIFEKAFGPEHPNVASSVLNLADLYFEQGKYSEAEPLYQRALAISEREFGPDHPYVGISLNNLANLYYEQGKYAQSEPRHKRALAIFETALGPDHPFVGYSLNSLGDLYHRQEMYAEAETLFEKALAVTERTLGSDHPEAAYSINKLADVYRDRGRYAEAEPLLKRSLEIFEKAVGPDHPDVGMGLNNLANLYRDQGKYPKAGPLYTRALETLEESLGPEHPKVALCLESFSYYYRLIGDLEKSLEMGKRAFEIRKKNFRIGSAVMSEKDALTYSQFMRKSANNLLSAYFDLGLDDEDLDYTAADVMFATKGQASEAIFVRAREMIMLDQLGALADSLRYARTLLSKLYVEGTTEEDPAVYKEKLDKASQDKERLESTLARSSTGFRSLQDALDVDAEKVADILGLLPMNAILVEYMKYDYFSPDLAENVAHYLAMTLNSLGEILVKDLGQSSGTDSLIDQYRAHLLSVSTAPGPPSVVDRVDYMRISQALYDRIWEPIQNQISDQDLVLVAPDGGLSIMSFAGLMNENGEYLIEKLPIHYLSSGRDLLRLKDQAESAAGLFALGDPDYDATPMARLSGSEAVPESLSELTYQATRNVRSACEELRGTILSQLPGTKVEVEEIARTWGSTSQEPTTICFGLGASEEAFKRDAPGNRVVHLATHGYFLEGRCQPSETRRGFDSEVGYIGENPLLLSGLFFAGANLQGEGADELGVEDGILTAEEVTAMNLDGTELAVLSACETGLGEVKDGEGVYGLRRAFQMAGARTVISALWPVSDKATAEMMSQLYASGRGSLPDILREIQLQKISDLRESKQADHPFSWGAFIALGDWR